MRFSKHTTVIWLALILSLIGLLVLAGLPAPTAQAGRPLPPRVKPTPIPKDDDDDEPVGAYIELHTQNAPAGAWAVVEWQDSDGNWQEVKGWQGTLLNGGHRRWWVDAKDFGKGPFRWVVREGPGGPVVGTSGLFDLPVEANQVLQVQASAP